MWLPWLPGLSWLRGLPWLPGRLRLGWLWLRCWRLLPVLGWLQTLVLSSSIFLPSL
jgi:hypothetical protein